mgnify:CR=1 FL=1
MAPAIADEFDHSWPAAAKLAASSSSPTRTAFHVFGFDLLGPDLAGDPDALWLVDVEPAASDGAPAWIQVSKLWRLGSSGALCVASVANTSASLRRPARARQCASDAAIS